MAREFNIQLSVTVAGGNTQFRSLPTSFTHDWTNKNGPSPGWLDIPITGIDIDLSRLTDPGVCLIQNVGTVYNFSFGIWDPEQVRYYPLGLVRPGKGAFLELFTELGGEYGTGTGTTAASTNTFHARGIGGIAQGAFYVFDR